MTARSALAVIDPIVGGWLLAAGLLGRRARPVSRAGVLMVIASLFWFVGAQVPQLVYAHRGPLVHLHLSYPGGRLRRASVVGVTLAAYIVSAVGGFVRLPWLTLSLSAAVAAVALDTYRRTVGPARKAGGPALLAALGLATVLGLSSLNELRQWEADVPIAFAYDAVICGAVTILVVDLASQRWVDATVTDLLLDLSARAGITGLRLQLRRALGDATPEVGFWIPDRGIYVDEAGLPVDPDAPPPGRVVTRLEDSDGPLVVLVHDPATVDDPTLLDGVAAAARLAVANARL